MRPISTILLFQLGCIGGGYLLTEACITLRYGNRAIELPLSAWTATRLAPLLVLLSVGWMAYALYAERRLQSKTTRERLPLAFGIGIATALFFFYIIAAFGLFTGPIHLHD